MIRGVPAIVRYPMTRYSPANSHPAVRQAPQDVPRAVVQRSQDDPERSEERLIRLEEEMRQTTYDAQRNNWPPLPESVCCIDPCFYQDIQVDIPIEFQTTVRYLYYLWMVHALTMMLNVLGGMIMADFTIIGLSFLYMILGVPVSYLCWFRPAYKGFRSNSSFNFIVFFFIFFFQFVVTVIQAIGIPNSGTIGIITALNMFKVSDTAGGIVATVVAIACSCAAAADVFLMTKVHSMYRRTGASFDRAQAEFIAEFHGNRQILNPDPNAADIELQFSSEFNNN